MQLESETFTVVHHLLLLILMDDDPNLSLLGELYTLAHCRAARLFISLQLNRTIRELLYKLCDQSTSKVMFVYFFTLFILSPVRNQMYLLSEGRNLEFSARCDACVCNMFIIVLYKRQYFFLACSNSVNNLPVF